METTIELTNGICDRYLADRTREGIEKSGSQLRELFCFIRCRYRCAILAAPAKCIDPEARKQRAPQDDIPGWMEYQEPRVNTLS
jgi:hypothetical protein